MAATAQPSTVPVPACPVCGDARREPLHEGLVDRVFGIAEGEWTLQRCRGCGAAYLDPRPRDEALADLYASYYTHAPPRPNLAPTTAGARALRALRNGHLRRLGYDLQPASTLGQLLGRTFPPFAALAERPVRALPAGARVLDIGAGNGLFVAEAAAWGLRASGIDLDAQAVAAGRRAGLDLEVATAAERAARETGAFDAVTLSHVIEHVPDPIELLRHCAQLLRPGGTIWLATPNLTAAGHDRFGPAWLHLDPPRHLVLFDAPALATALEGAGFRDVRTVRPSAPAREVYARSAAIQRGEIGRADGPVTVPGEVGRAARAAGLLAQVRPARAEELVMVASVS